MLYVFENGLVEVTRVSKSVFQVYLLVNKISTLSMSKYLVNYLSWLKNSVGEVIYIPTITFYGPSDYNKIFTLLAVETDVDNP